MTPRDFVYWLQGYFEIHQSDKPDLQFLTSAQTTQVRNHLDLVFEHIDLEAGDDPELQKKLNDIHSGTVKPHKKKKGPLIRC